MGSDSSLPDTFEEITVNTAARTVPGASNRMGTSDISTVRVRTGTGLRSSVARRSVKDSPQDVVMMPMETRMAINDVRCILTRLALECLHAVQFARRKQDCGVGHILMMSRFEN